MENSAISWCDHTANLWIGCMHVHPGCDNCYAEATDNRWKGNHWGARTNRKIVVSVWDNLIRFQKLAKESGEIHRVFVGSMMDIFEKPYPVENSKGILLDHMTTEDIRRRFFYDIVPSCPNLQFLLLTKRPGNIKKYIPESWLETPPENVIYGYSVVDQQTTDGIDDLVSIPGRHFLSMEPLLDRIDLSKWLWSPGWVPTYNNPDNSGCEPDFEPSGLIDWIIVGGESGHKARPMEQDWAREIRDQADRAGVPFHFKQWGQHEPDENGIMRHVKVKDHNAKIDGVERKEFPK